MRKSKPVIGSAVVTLPEISVQGRATAHSPLTSVPGDHLFFHLIGRVAAKWAQFEHTLDLIIWSLTGQNDAIMACITAQIMGAQSRCHAITALLRVRGLPGALDKECKALIKDTHGPQTARNRVVHDPWFLESGTDVAGRFKKMARDEWIYGIHSVTKDQIIETIQKIHNLQTKASRFRESALAALTPSPEREPP